MAMRSMFRLRKLINRLLAEGKIDADTTIHIEFARELNDANKRAALHDYQRENQNEKDKARKAIMKSRNLSDYTRNGIRNRAK